MGRVGLPAPLSELASTRVGRDRRRRRPQRPHRSGLPGAGRALGAGAGAPRAARRRLHPGAALLRSALRGQPLRLRGRPARRAGGLRARAGEPRLPRLRRRAQLLGAASRRQLLCQLPRSPRHRRAPAPQRLLRARHRGTGRLRGRLRALPGGAAPRACRRHLARLLSVARADRGGARWGSRADLDRLRGVDRRDDRHATWRTSASTTRSSARGSPAPTPGRAIPAPPRSS